MPSYQRHLFRYRYDGQSWSFEIPASSAAEARERLARLGSAQYDGVVVATVPVSGLPVRLVEALRSLGRRLLGFLAA